ncbi:MAG: hypothetical protein AAGF66_19905 [Cyanobacteria bacterium P01_H01_bin.119]
MSDWRVCLHDANASSFSPDKTGAGCSKHIEETTTPALTTFSMPKTADKTQRFALIYLPAPGERLSHSSAQLLASAA